MSRPDQMMMDVGREKLLIQAGKDCLMAVTGMMLDDEHFLFEPKNIVIIIPGQPLAELLPLEQHEAAVRKMVRRAMNEPEAAGWG